MKKEIIKEKSKILAIILRNGDYSPGLVFYNNDKDFIQVGTWHYQKGMKLKAHRHKIYPRIALRTQEVVYVKSGEIKVFVYNDKEKLKKKIKLTKGDIMIFLNGGHSFEILENNTQVFEVKNGPYLGVEKDKKIIKHEEK